MAVRTTAVSAAAVLATAAVAVYALHVVRRNRRLQSVLDRERATHRLTAGCLVRDLEVFRRRMNQVLAQHAVIAAAGLVLDESLARHDHKTIPPTEGGPR
jgi:hypothetical protein